MGWYKGKWQMRLSSSKLIIGKNFQTRTAETRKAVRWGELLQFNSVKWDDTQIHTAVQGKWQMRLSSSKLIMGKKSRKIGHNVSLYIKLDSNTCFLYSMPNSCHDSLIKMLNSTLVNPGQWLGHRQSNLHTMTDTKQAEQKTTSEGQIK